ncbi:MAG: T9SS type A sorting domain-containing protein [Bacteroidales bacterium]|nr:T9SS type A sorting domain-containing protein [Bacteroidales bacterium]
MTVRVGVDLDNDWGEFYLDDILIHGWFWSTGTFGTGTLNQLGGSNFYAWDGGVYANPDYYIDNYLVDYIGTWYFPPQNVTAVVENENDVFIDWVPPLGGSGELIELIQHDGNPENGYFQEFDNGYGVVYDISGFPDCTIEYLDFRHSSWGIYGTWDYKLHIVDWNTYTEVGVIGPLQTTGDDIWELGIDLGSIEGLSGSVGVFLEPLSNDPDNAYPCLDSDNWGPDGLSFQGLLNNYSEMTLSTIGDFLMDLWILSAEDKIFVESPKIPITQIGSGISRNAGNSLSGTKYIIEQMDITNNETAILQGYNIYGNDVFIDYIPIPTTEYNINDLDPGFYEYCISAVYDEGESIPACADPVIVFGPPGPTPYNLTGPDYIELGDTICLTWDFPGAAEWIRWDAGINTGNGIGVLGGGPFSCASHWYPDQLMDYNGLQIMEIEFYANGDPDATYIIKIWTGPDGTNEVLSQEVTSFNVDDWNTVVLNAPHTISAAEDLWFGYEVTHTFGTYPAGCDDGPAIPYNGDMINVGAGWESLSVDIGYDYNFNLAALVGLTDGSTLKPMCNTVDISPSIINPSSSDSKWFNNSGLSKATKDFSHFNLYVKTPGVSFFVVYGTTTDPEFCYVPTVSGSHEFFVTMVWDPEGESGPSNIHVCDVLTGIEETFSSSTKVYPNPASDIVTIESEFEIVSLKVYTPKGQIVTDELINNNNYKFDASLLNPGIYFLQIDFEDDRILRKIVIE